MSAAAGNAITFRTSGDGVTNLGTIFSPIENALDFQNPNGLAGETVNNLGIINAARNGVSLYSENGTVADSTVSNSGNITAGHNGVDFDSENGSVAGDTVNNSGNITSGHNTVEFYSEYGGSVTDSTVNNWGGINGGSSGGNAVLIECPYGSISNSVVNNWGRINAGGGGNRGINIYSTDTVINTFINNWGVISANVGDGSAIAIQGDPASDNTVNNWGVIAGNGIGGNSIYITGNNNTVNLNGHSVISGPLQAYGTGNAVNLHFTGISPAENASIVAQLKHGGTPFNDGQTGTGSVTVRGEAVEWNSMIVNVKMSSYEGQSVTPSQFAIGANLDSLTDNPAPGTSLFNLLNAIDNSGAVPRALDALSPQKFEIYGDLAIANTTQMAREIDQRLDNLRDGGESVDLTGFGGGIDPIAESDSKDADDKEGKSVATPGGEGKRWGFFASGNGIFFRGHRDDRDEQEGDSNSGGTLAGFDARINENAVMGAFFSFYDAEAAPGNDGSHAIIDSYSGGVYGGWCQDGYYVNGLAAYTRNDYSSTRKIRFPGFESTAAGNTNGNQHSVSLDGGHDWDVAPGLTVGPLAGVQYVHLGIDSFAESGPSAADLAVGNQTMNSFQSRLGARAEYLLRLKSFATFSAEFTAAWQHEYMDGPRGIGADFIGSGLAPFRAV